MSFKHTDTTELIIKAFYTVYNTLGYGFLEKVYRNALAIELHKLGLKAIPEARSLRARRSGHGPSHRARLPPSRHWRAGRSRGGDPLRLFLTGSDGLVGYALLTHQFPVPALHSTTGPRCGCEGRMLVTLKTLRNS